MLNDTGVIGNNCSDTSCSLRSNKACLHLRIWSGVIWLHFLTPSWVKDRAKNRIEVSVMWSALAAQPSSSSLQLVEALLTHLQANLRIWILRILHVTTINAFPSSDLKSLFLHLVIYVVILSSSKRFVVMPVGSVVFVKRSLQISSCNERLRGMESTPNTY